MKEDLAHQLKGTYEGDFVSSLSDDVTSLTVSVTRLSDLLVKVSFVYHGIPVIFRAMLSEHKEGTLMLIQERITENYILNGVNGFLYRKKNVHGGFVSNLESFYFHLRFDLFESKQQEFYFIGKNTEIDTQIKRQATAVHGV